MASAPTNRGRVRRPPDWEPELPRIAPAELVLRWLASAIALLVASQIISAGHIAGFGDAVAVAAILAVLNAVLSPLLAALRIPFIALAGFFLVLLLDAGMLMLAARIAPGAHPGRQLRLGDRLRARRRGGEHGLQRDLRRRRRRRVLACG